MILDNNDNYKLEILLRPQYMDVEDSNSPLMYFWCILYNPEGDMWCNSGSGWSPTIEQAFVDAQVYYKKIITNG